MDDEYDEKDDTKRTARNLSEKKRRDAFNMLVNELSSMVCTGNRKMDKSSILKSTILYLKNHNEFTVRSRVHDVQEDWKPSFLSNEDFTYLVMEALESFIMVFSVTGRICYVSKGITSFLGYIPDNIINKILFNLIHEEDRPILYNMLQNPGTCYDAPSNILTKENEFKFQCRIRRGALYSNDDPLYELVQLTGYFRSNPEQETEESTNFSQEDNKLLFVCTVRLCTPQLIRNVSLPSKNSSEFVSKHSLELKFLFLDHRASPIIGYLPFEVLGTSVYDYYHFDDLEKVISCHQTLMQKGVLTSCYYRFLTKGQQWIWLQTQFYITYHQWNSKPEFVVCTHKVVNYDDIVNVNEKDSMGGADDSLSKTTSIYPLACAAELSLNISADSTNNNCMFESNGPFFSSPYQEESQPQSLKSVSTTRTIGNTVTVSTPAAVTTTWSHGPGSYHVSSNTTMSDNSDNNINPQQMCMDGDPTVMPQHVMGAQFLQPSSYGPVVSSNRMPSPIQQLPAAVSPSQPQLPTFNSNNNSVDNYIAQRVTTKDNIGMETANTGSSANEEQLQRKHEQLQQMIQRQQQELRHVREQLLMARLGILTPRVNTQNQYLAAPETDMLQGNIEESESSHNTFMQR